jgi:hypothetical protein
VHSASQVADGHDGRRHAAPASERVNGCQVRLKAADRSSTCRPADATSRPLNQPTRKWALRTCRPYEDDDYAPRDHRGPGSCRLAGQGGQLEPGGTAGLLRVVHDAVVAAARERNRRWRRIGAVGFLWRRGPRRKQRLRNAQGGALRLDADPGRPRQPTRAAGRYSAGRHSSRHQRCQGRTGRAHISRGDLTWRSRTAIW